LVDSNGNVVGSLFVNGDGNVAIQDETATETEFTPNGVVTPSVETDAVRTETIGAGDYLYAGDFDGADADARLDNALTTVSDGDSVALESSTYADDRTISTQISISGPQPVGGADITGSWTVANLGSELNTVRFSSAGTLTVTGARSSIINVYNVGDGITVDADRVKLTGHLFGDITFQSGTSGGLVDSSVSVTVTDNGANTVGDIS
jgi:hypothetical protein